MDLHYARRARPPPRQQPSNLAPVTTLALVVAVALIHFVPLALRVSTDGLERAAAAPARQGAPPGARNHALLQPDLLPPLRAPSLSHLLRPAGAQAASARAAPAHFRHRRAVLMSCPVGPAHTNQGAWKPRNMARGVEAVASQLVAHASTLPLYFAYYGSERRVSEPFCRNLAARFASLLPIHCFQVPDKYPYGQYGYAKIAALRRAPVEQVLWLDCDVFPLRDLSPLFDDTHFKQTGAMFWPDSRDHFDEYGLVRALSPKIRPRFPLRAWYVRQGFDTGIVLLDRKKVYHHLSAVHNVSTDEQFSPLRKLSMGDKDLFHVVWMMLDTNFTLVPYVGETGTLQKQQTFAPRIIHNHVVDRATWMHNWAISSQVKFGRDGLAYALHQLYHYTQTPEPMRDEVHVTKSRASAHPEAVPPGIARAAARTAADEASRKAAGARKDVAGTAPDRLPQGGKLTNRGTQQVTEPKHPQPPPQQHPQQRTQELNQEHSQQPARPQQRNSKTPDQQRARRPRPCFITPRLIARKDLRIGRAPGRAERTRHENGDFLRDVESLTIDKRANMPRPMPRGRATRADAGLIVERVPPSLFALVRRLDRLWNGAADVHEAAHRIATSYFDRTPTARARPFFNATAA